METRSTKRRKTLGDECIVCNEKSSTFKMCLCQNKCEYHVCVNCTFQFSVFINGSSLNHLRVKCMLCRNSIETLPGKELVETILQDTPNIETNIHDPIRNCDVQLKKSRVSGITSRTIKRKPKEEIRWIIEDSTIQNDLRNTSQMLTSILENFNDNFFELEGEGNDEDESNITTITDSDLHEFLNFLFDAPPSILSTL